MRFRIVSLAAACSFLSAFPVSADVLTLKNGEKIEGTILREEGENYVVEVQVTTRIRDEKIIPRAEVLKIEKTPDHEKAFTEIANLNPAPELLAAEGYEQRIKKLRGYIEAFPASPKNKHVEWMIKSLEDELALIKGGAIKLGDVVIPAEDYEANAYEYDARIAEKRIRDAVSRRDYLGALRGFDSYEASLGTSEGHAGLASLMMQVLGAYSESIAESLANLDNRMAAREAGLARMTPGDRAKSQRALEAEQSQLAERLQEEKTAKMKWVTPHAYFKESLEEAQKQATAEMARLDKLEAEVETPLSELYRTAWEKLKTAEDDEEKQAILDDAKEKGLPETYLGKLTESARIGEEPEESDEQEESDDSDDSEEPEATEEVEKSGE
jgi:hypothetical protein